MGFTTGVVLRDQGPRRRSTSTTPKYKFPKTRDAKEGTTRVGPTPLPSEERTRRVRQKEGSRNTGSKAPGHETWDPVPTPHPSELRDPRYGQELSFRKVHPRSTGDPGRSPDRPGLLPLDAHTFCERQTLDQPPFLSVLPPPVRPVSRMGPNLLAPVPRGHLYSAKPERRGFSPEPSLCSFVSDNPPLPFVKGFGRK